MSMRRSLVVGLGAVFLASSCTSTEPLSPTPTGTGSSSSSVAPPSTTQPPMALTVLASGKGLPDGCTTGFPQGGDTVAFVAQGRAWALNPSGSHLTLTCLFDVDDPGPFAWGPLGDRVLLGDLEVKGLRGAPTSPAQDLVPGPSSWGRPTGKSIVFVPPDGASLEKVHLDGTAMEDVTPLDDTQYLSVAYHPSGLAFAFAVQRGERQSVWMSSNVGEDARRLVFSSQGTKFGSVAFGQDGVALYYGAQLADGRPELHVLDLLDPTEAPTLWEGSAGQVVENIWPGPQPGDAAFTVGSSCADDTAMVVNRTESEARPAVPDESRPTRVLGWLNGAAMLVAAGGCGEPSDLSAVDAYSGEVVPLVFGVNAAGVRTPAPTPPPPLPEGTGVGGSFG
jgi:hypothetical protein